MKRKKVVLFFPAYGSNEASPPLALIAIAGPLVTAGYDVKIIDSALEPDYVSAVVKETEGAVCLGISLVTGPMIQGAIAVGRAVKSRYPALPVVLGGWHPSILPRQTLECPYVDVVVLKQGELAFLEVVHRLEAGESLAGIPGTATKQDEVLAFHPPRAYTPVALLPSRMPGYELIDYERYHLKTHLRWLLYTTSHGCPYDCAYCSNASVYGRNLDELPAEQVVDEVSYLIRKYHIRLLGIIDDIFFASRARSLAIAEGFIRAGLNFEWYIQDRADSWERLSDAQCDLYRRSGLVRVHFGAESGSDEVLRAIGKRSGAQSILSAAGRCKTADIRASFGFIFGLPSEKEEDLKKSVDLIRAIYETYERADCYTNVFTPYPGSPAWQESIDKDLVPPHTLEDWADFYPRLQVLPWLAGIKHDRMQAIRQYIRFGYHQVKVGEQNETWYHRLLFAALKPVARYRLKRHQYRFPLEIYGYRGLLRLKRDLLQT